ncbi:MAG: OsmC family protein [Acidobacteriia bacterium]|nr:OsmC family protein [Terriglobia bacterium]
MSSAPQETSLNDFTITLEQLEDFEFRVRFDKPQFPEWRLDEPAPLGRDAWPSASRALAAAIGNCLSASLLFCARKAQVQLGPIKTRVRTETRRNERGRLRIAKVEVEIDPGIPEPEMRKALRCLGLFEDYCVVTQSVREGIDVRVSVTGLDSPEIPQ